MVHKKHCQQWILIKHQSVYEFKITLNGCPEQNEMTHTITQIQQHIHCKMECKIENYTGSQYLFTWGIFFFSVHGLCAVKLCGKGNFIFLLLM